MTKHITLFFLFVSLLLSTVQAQFNKGYIITLDEDTVQGFLRNIPDLGYERSVQFKPERKGTSAIIFTADEIAGFFVYPSLDFQAFTSPIPSDSLSHVFMEKLFMGRLNMYKLELSSDQLYFVQKNDGPLMQLESKDNLYYDLLAKLTRDCERMRFPSVFTLSSNNLVRFAQKYEIEKDREESRKMRN
jgi:hypothetical protein